MKNNDIIITKNAKATQEIGESFGKTLLGGVVALYGDLGSGKTTFVQGLAKGLGIKNRIISPTFIIVRSYKLDTKKTTLFYHIDLYRTTNSDDFNGVGLFEILSNPDNIVVIEWAEKMQGMLPKKRIDITFEYVDENKRNILIKK